MPMKTVFVSDQSDPSDFVEGSFRTITLSADQGIQAVIGKLKSDPNRIYRHTELSLR